MLETVPAAAEGQPASGSIRTHWRLLITPPSTGAYNMALDEALLRRAAASGEAVLRVYCWRSPTLSLGRHQLARGRYASDRLEELGIEVVRRPTGGRAVLHYREVTYSVAAPIAASQSSLRESYEQINRLLMSGLRRLGVPVEVAAPTGRAPGPDVAPCFQSPTAGELVWNGRKLVGSAQYREAGALLQHGSILIDDDQSLVSSLLVEAALDAVGPATLREILDRAPMPSEIAEALFAAVRELEDETADPLIVDHSLALDAHHLRSKYHDPAWTWRR